MAARFADEAISEVVVTRKGKYYQLESIQVVGGSSAMVMSCTLGRHDHHDVYAAQCPCRDVLDLLANKWSALAIGALEKGPQRFGVLQRQLDGISPKVLTNTLRRLETMGFLDRTIYPAVPLHVEYGLTALGRSVAEPLAGLRIWVEQHLDEIDIAQPAQP